MDNERRKAKARRRARLWYKEHKDQALLGAKQRYQQKLKAGVFDNPEVKNSRNAAARRSYHKNKVKVSKKYKRYYRNRSEDQRQITRLHNKWATLKYRTGMTKEEFLCRMNEQDNRCKMCGSPFTEADRPSVDHNHACCDKAKSCGKCVRGIIHNTCNAILGLAKDSVLKLYLGISYLGENHGTVG